MEFAERKRLHVNRCRAGQHQHGRRGTEHQPDRRRKKLASPARVGGQHNGKCRHGAYRHRRCRKYGTHQTPTKMI